MRSRQSERRRFRESEADKSYYDRDSDGIRQPLSKIEKPTDGSAARRFRRLNSLATVSGTADDDSGTGKINSNGVKLYIKDVPGQDDAVGQFLDSDSG